MEIVPDFDKPYKSMITGEAITSRAKHREHLRRYGYTEVGNDASLTAPYKGMPDANPQQRKELLRAQVDAMTHEQFKEARHKLGLSVADMAAMLGVGELQVRRMEIAPGHSSHRPVNGTVERLLKIYLAGHRPKDWPKN